MTAIVFGSPEAAAIRDADRQIELLQPCRCGGAPVVRDDLVYGATHWYSVECANRHCRRKHCSTMLYDEIADALAEWRQYHPDKERN